MSTRKAEVPLWTATPTGQWDAAIMERVYVLVLSMAAFNPFIAMMKPASNLSPKSTRPTGIVG